jgi:branched-chain amino acid transport system substrate-binding protein
MMRRIIVFPSLLLSCTIIIAGFRTDLSTPGGVSIVDFNPPPDSYQDPQEGLLFNMDLKSPLGDLGVKSTIKIGLLIQDNNSVEARNGAEMAIAEANKSGGFNGREFELIVKSMEGPWGTGSKQAVDLIFNDGVIAIAGSHDGRNAHLVEQVTTKAHIVFLSAWTGDPTLSQAFTPWFFNCAPNDNQQAEMLAGEIKLKNYRKVTLVVDDDYDTNSAFRSFIRKSAESYPEDPTTIKLDKSEQDLSETAGKIIRMKPECLVLFTNPATADKILYSLSKMSFSVPVYGPLLLIGENSPLYHHPDVLKNLLLFSSGNWFNKEKSEFAFSYHNKFELWPGAPAAFSYDAIMLIINGAKACEADKEKMKETLIHIEFKGTTGIIKFDGKGNRLFTIANSE